LFIDSSVSFQGITIRHLPAIDELEKKGFPLFTRLFGSGKELDAVSEKISLAQSYLLLELPSLFPMLTKIIPEECSLVEFATVKVQFGSTDICEARRLTFRFRNREFKVYANREMNKFHSFVKKEAELLEPFQLVKFYEDAYAKDKQRVCALSPDAIRIMRCYLESLKLSGEVVIETSEKTVAPDRGLGQWYNIQIRIDEVRTRLLYVAESGQELQDITFFETITYKMP
jgi:hypothetical protein